MTPKVHTAFNGLYILESRLGFWAKKLTTDEYARQEPFASLELARNWTNVYREGYLAPEEAGTPQDQWKVVPNYSAENKYTLWDMDGNYHEDTSVAAMDARARLMQAAPQMLAALQEADRLYTSYGLVANSFDCGEWINKVRKAIALAERGER